jgi:hypothetical protein
LTVKAETLIPGGSPLPPEHGAAPFAALLACLIASAPDPAAVPGLPRRAERRLHRHLKSDTDNSPEWIRNSVSNALGHGLFPVDLLFQLVLIDAA